MKPGRLIAIFVFAAAAFWIWKHPGELKKLAPGGASETPKAPDSPQNSQLNEAAREAEKSSATGVTENMTPEQVRGLLGSPDEVETYTTDAGKPGEKWTYREAHRMVVFENGIAISVQPL